jgi:hypothetical protein
VVCEERPPGLRGLGRTLGHEARDGTLATSMPSLRSLPWVRGAPHRGFAAAIVRTRLAISALRQGRPPVGRRESWAQYSRKRQDRHLLI